MSDSELTKEEVLSVRLCRWQGLGTCVGAPARAGGVVIGKTVQVLDRLPGRCRWNSLNLSPNRLREPPAGVIVPCFVSDGRPTPRRLF